METRVTVLNFQPSTSIPVVHVSQYDVGVPLRFILYDGSSPADIEGGSQASVVMTATRPSGTGFTVPCTIIASNIVSVDTTEAMTIEFGSMEAEIRYANNGTTVGTGNFIFDVEAAAHADYIIDEDHAEWVRISQEVQSNATNAQRAETNAQSWAQQALSTVSQAHDYAEGAVEAAATATRMRNEAVTAKNQAEAAEDNANASALNASDSADAAQLAADDAEAYAVGTRGGEPVTSTDPTYHNNAKYYAEQGGAANLAQTFDASTAYAVDDYVLYNSKLWRFTTAHAAGAWNASHVAEVKAMDEVSDLKGDLKNVPLQFIDGHYVVDGGSTNIGDVIDLQNLGTYSTTKYSITDCSEGDVFLINCSGGDSARVWAFLTSNNVLISRSNKNLNAQNLYVTAPNNSAKIIVHGNIPNGDTAYKVSKLNMLTNNAVRFDVIQEKTEEEKAIARTNIGVESVSGLSNNVKIALLNCFKHVFWEDDGNWYQQLYTALYSGGGRLIALYEPGDYIAFVGDRLSDLKHKMIVMYDGNELEQSDYDITGELIEGNSVIAVRYNNETVYLTIPTSVAKNVLRFTDSDVVKYNGGGMGYDPNGVIAVPYLNTSNADRAFYSVKGHYPYRDTSNSIMTGVYPIPVPPNATTVTIALTPSTLRIACSHWEYNASSNTYSWKAETSFTAGTITHNMPITSDKPRALNMIIKTSDSTAFTNNTEPSQCIITFS